MKTYVPCGGLQSDMGEVTLVTLGNIQRAWDARGRPRSDPGGGHPNDLATLTSNFPAKLAE